MVHTPTDVHSPHINPYGIDMLLHYYPLIPSGLNPPVWFSFFLSTITGVTQGQAQATTACNTVQIAAEYPAASQWVRPPHRPS